jgi:hypothetical protein
MTDRAELIRPVLTGWSFACVPAIDMPDGLWPGPRKAGDLWTFGPGMRPDIPTRVIDLPEAGAVILGVLDQAHRAATGRPLRVRLGTPLAVEDGLVLADVSFSPGLAEAARIRAQGRGQGGV